MTWHGNTFCIIGPLRRESIDWWIPLTKGQWCWALMFALLIQPSSWRNSVVACDLICIAANPWPMKSGTPTITFRDIWVFSGTLSGTFWAFSGTLKILIYTIILNFVTFFFINIFSNQSYCYKGPQIANWQDFYLTLKQVDTIAQWYFHCHAASLFFLNIQRKLWKAVQTQVEMRCWIDFKAPILLV